MAKKDTCASLCDLSFKQFTAVKLSAYKKELKTIKAKNLYYQAMQDHCELTVTMLIEMSIQSRIIIAAN